MEEEERKRADDGGGGGEESTELRTENNQKNEAVLQRSPTVSVIMTSDASPPHPPPEPSSDLEAWFSEPMDSLMLRAENNVRRRVKHGGKNGFKVLSLLEDVEDQISVVPSDLQRGICLFLFENETCPSPDLEKYVVRYYKIRAKKRGRKWTEQEDGFLKMARWSLLNLVEDEAMDYRHSALRFAYLDGAEAAFRVTEILVETYEDNRFEDFTTVLTEMYNNYTGTELTNLEFAQLCQERSTELLQLAKAYVSVAKQPHRSKQIGQRITFTIELLGEPSLDPQYHAEGAGYSL